MGAQVSTFYTMPRTTDDGTNGYSLAPSIVGSSPALQHLLGAAARIAASQVKVLITGESGVGKDVLARFIHNQSRRNNERFVALNCAGVPETLLESELFGHVKGSFTGAYRDKLGSLEQAHRGTIFLDEIGDMGLRMQALLLRFLETGELQAVGSDTPAVRVDVRVIAATNRNLAEMVDRGEFRQDLYYRIHVVHLHVPPLRERIEDIRPLVEHFLARSATTLTVSDEAMRLLESYGWPGNVRELLHTIEQVSLFASGRSVEPEDLPKRILAQQPGYVTTQRERRHSVADDLYDGLTSGKLRFWENVYPLFTNRDITRADVRHLIRRGLTATSGSYRGLLPLFGLERHDYKAMLNFLAAHDCMVDYRKYRPGSAETETKSQATSGRRRKTAS
jgi:transcriptional regulator with PAS, ATPase and Fis domain